MLPVRRQLSGLCFLAGTDPLKGWRAGDALADRCRRFVVSPAVGENVFVVAEKVVGTARNAAPQVDRHQGQVAIGDPEKARYDHVVRRHKGWFGNTDSSSAIIVRLKVLVLLCSNPFLRNDKSDGFCLRKDQVPHHADHEPKDKAEGGLVQKPRFVSHGFFDGPCQVVPALRGNHVYGFPRRKHVEDAVVSVAVEYGVVGTHHQGESGCCCCCCCFA
mmetsp:Transcript_110802/g.226762  ORF Transcript_110802/g.226762 Transcript_110802/m.226762 type:complete len:217 (-) Transcript_110802:147-797(-)